MLELLLRNALFIGDRAMCVFGNRLLCSVDDFGWITLPKHLYTFEGFYELLVRLVSQCKERITLRCKKNVLRPASVPRGFAGKFNQVTIKVGHEFSVDFDGNKMLIEVVSDLLIPIVFTLHDMTPMARKVTT